MEWLPTAAVSPRRRIAVLSAPKAGEPDPPPTGQPNLNPSTVSHDRDGLCVRNHTTSEDCRSCPAALSKPCLVFLLFEHVGLAPSFIAL